MIVDRIVKSRLDSLSSRGKPDIDTLIVYCNIIEAGEQEEKAERIV
jgi:hypothetical protein